MHTTTCKHKHVHTNTHNSKPAHTRHTHTKAPFLQEQFCAFRPCLRNHDLPEQPPLHHRPDIHVHRIFVRMQQHRTFCKGGEPQAIRGKAQKNFASRGQGHPGPLPSTTFQYWWAPSGRGSSAHAGLRFTFLACLLPPPVPTPLPLPLPPSSAISLVLCPAAHILHVL